MSGKPHTAATVNAALRRAGIPVRIRSGGSYYYWVTADHVLLDDAMSAYVYRASQLPIDRWIEMARAEAERCSEQLKTK
jgi:hypothetical protein